MNIAMLKKLVAVALFMTSLSAMAIPPVPPQSTTQPKDVSRLK